MTPFNEIKSEVFLYYTVELVKSYTSLLVAKVYIMTVAHYVT